MISFARWLLFSQGGSPPPPCICIESCLGPRSSKEIYTVRSESRCAIRLRYADRYTDLVQERFAEESPETPILRRNAFRRLTEKVRETGLVLDAERNRRYHFLHLL
jgi:hypothetical protein